MELFVDFVLFCIQAVFWYWIIGLAVGVWRAYKAVKSEEVSEFAEKIAEVIHKVQEEKHGDHFYWFDSDSDQFLAQGATVDDMVAHLKSRFPAHIFFLSKDNQHFYICNKTDWKFVPIEIKSN
jgi:hypothetical protein